MGIRVKVDKFNEILKAISKDYKVFAPVVQKGKNTFSETDLIAYKEVKSIEKIEFNKKAQYSSKEAVMPITQTLFYFTEENYTEPKLDSKKVLVFLRSCDIHAFKRTDEIFLKNGLMDNYYKVLRDKIKFVLMGCEKSFDNCFCVSMGTNTTEDYQMYVKPSGDEVLMDIKDEELKKIFMAFEDDNLTMDDNFNLEGNLAIEEVKPEFVKENSVEVKISQGIDKSLFSHEMWKEYDERCIACGRCNFACPTCTCFTMQDIFYKDNKNAGERRRVWASCQIEGYTDMAGGHSFRKANGDRMRFKVMHKIYDFEKRFGYHMCVGCGRCDDICPQYISLSNCINKINHVVGELK